MYKHDGINMTKLDEINKLIKKEGYKIFFFDFETTGLGIPMPIEIGICDKKSCKIIDNVIKTNRVNEGYCVNKICDSDICNGLDKKKIIEKIIDVCGKKTIFVSHNCAGIDMKILLWELQNFVDDWYFLCTMEYAKTINEKSEIRNIQKTKTGRPSFTLDSLKEAFGISTTKSHRAYDDAVACKLIFEKLVEIDTNTYNNFDDLEKKLFIKFPKKNIYDKFSNITFKNLVDTEKVTSLVDMENIMKNCINTNCPKISAVCDIIELKKYNQYTYVILKNNGMTIKGRIFNSWFNKLPTISNKINVEGKLQLYNNSLEIFVFDYEVLGQSDKKKDRDTILLELKQLIDRPRKEIKNNYKKIGIISSLKSKGFEDITKTILRNSPKTEIVLYNTFVQGANASKSIIDCINMANKHNYVDILALIRGGGSVEDYATFDDVELAKTIVASKIPVVTGIGHSTDTTIADMVAEKWFITPTACGDELTNQSISDIDFLKHKLMVAMLEINNNNKYKINTYYDKIKTLYQKKIDTQIQNNNECCEKIKKIMIEKYCQIKNKIDCHEMNLKQFLSVYCDTYNRNNNKTRNDIEKIYNNKILELSLGLNKKYNNIIKSLINCMKK